MLQKAGHVPAEVRWLTGQEDFIFSLAHTACTLSGYARIDNGLAGVNAGYWLIEIAKLHTNFLSAKISA